MKNLLDEYKDVSSIQKEEAIEKAYKLIKEQGRYPSVSDLILQYKEEDPALAVALATTMVVGRWEERWIGGTWTFDEFILPGAKEEDKMIIANKLGISVEKLKENKELFEKEQIEYAKGEVLSQMDNVAYALSKDQYSVCSKLREHSDKEFILKPAHFLFRDPKDPEKIDRDRREEGEKFLNDIGETLRDKVLVNCSGRLQEEWSKEQREYMEGIYGKIVDFSFPEIPVGASIKEIKDIIGKLESEISLLGPDAAIYPSIESTFEPLILTKLNLYRVVGSNIYNMAIGENGEFKGLEEYQRLKTSEEVNKEIRAFHEGNNFVIVTTKGENEEIIEKEAFKYSDNVVKITIPKIDPKISYEEMTKLQNEILLKIIESEPAIVGVQTKNTLLAKSLCENINRFDACPVLANINKDEIKGFLPINDYDLKDLEEMRTEKAIRTGMDEIIQYKEKCPKNLLETLNAIVEYKNSEIIVDQAWDKKFSELAEKIWVSHDDMSKNNLIESTLFSIRENIIERGIKYAHNLAEKNVRKTYKKEIVVTETIKENISYRHHREEVWNCDPLENYEEIIDLYSKVFKDTFKNTRMTFEYNDEEIENLYEKSLINEIKKQNLEIQDVKTGNSIPDFEKMIFLLERGGVSDKKIMEAFEKDLSSEKVREILNNLPDTPDRNSPDR